jgi:hypothetical protein
MTELSDDLKKFLTETVLRECWHEICPYSNTQQGTDIELFCSKCNESFGISVLFDPGKGNRPFTTHPDLIALYEAVDRKLMMHLLNDYMYERYTGKEDNYFSWLFCLNHPEQIPERVKMVAEFMGWKE